MTTQDRGGDKTGGWEQTPQQAAVTRQDGSGRTDAERDAAWPKDGAGSAAKKPAPGGSSQGESDRKPSDD